MAGSPATAGEVKLSDAASAALATAGVTTATTTTLPQAGNPAGSAATAPDAKTPVQPMALLDGTILVEHHTEAGDMERQEFC